MAVVMTEDQTEKLQQFQELTGIEDDMQCRDMLEIHNWNIETAVQDQLNINEGRPAAYVAQNDNTQNRLNIPPAVPVVLTANNPYIFQAVVPGYGPTQWFGYLFTLPFRLFYNTCYGIISFVWRMLRPESRRAITDPVADVTEFIAEYEEYFGTNHPVFYQGSYSQALNDAKAELRFLLVYLHCDDHQDTAKFCRNTLTDSNVITYVNRNTLFWGCSVTTPEGYRVSQALRENAYPFLAVIVLRENRMTVVGRVEGNFTPADLVTQLETIVQNNEAYLTVAREERNERTFNQTLRDQQDEAYRESLKADQEKVRQKQLEQQQREQEELQRLAEVQNELQRKEDVKRRKSACAMIVPEEPVPNDPDAIRVSIKLPNGSRLERRFLKQQSMKYLYYFVFSHPDSPNLFEIATNFPKRVLPCEPTDEIETPPTFENAGLGKSEVLFVYDLEA